MAGLAGVRYIQAPLCGPSERRRRPRSLTFDQLTPLGPMNHSTSQPIPPSFDPVRADWLPVQIYASNEYRARKGIEDVPSDGWQVHRYCQVSCASFHGKSNVSMNPLEVADV